MPQVTSYQPGTPSWVDLGTTDTEAARSFYGRLFGWDFEVGGPETGGYTMCRLRGLSVAGIWELMPEMTAQGIPPNWMTYFSTNDLDGTVKRINDSGGTLMDGPMDIREQGRMAIATDPTGAVFGLWEPAAHIGAEMVNEPGSLVWNELMTRDRAAALAFYVELFGYTTEEMDMGEEGPYVVLKVDDRPIGGLMAMPSDMPDGVPPFWGTCFAVADADAWVQQAKAAGATVTYGPEDSPYGRFAVLMDPLGAGFSVMGVGGQGSEQGTGQGPGQR